MNLLLQTMLLLILQSPVPQDKPISDRIDLPDYLMVFEINDMSLFLSNSKLWCDNKMSAFVLVEKNKVIGHGCWTTIDNDVVVVYDNGEVYQYSTDKFIPVKRIIKSDFI